MLSKKHRLIYTDGQIVNTDWREVQTGFTWPGAGLSSFESDNFADVQAMIDSLGLALPVDQNAP